MDFFSAQDDAHKNTKWLVLLFMTAVVGIIVLLYLVAILATSKSHSAQAAEVFQWWQPQVFYTVAILTASVILLGSLYKTLRLAGGGGAAVAESLGGRLVNRGTRDMLERRLLNVVDEMAIASGVPVPKVYILDHELAINAFAAGYDVQHAVVAVTRGTLEQLSRDELQGVVAHEFSHILNGDMRINIRLIGILFGILLLAIAGRFILRGSRGSSKNAGAIIAIGLALIVVGYLGLFFGRLIKAAVSRQREFLADASGVQFTRNPSGLAGALKKIGGFSGSTIEHPDAEEASHMFFETGVAMKLNMFATHPPLEERIRRIEPMFSGELQRHTAVAEESAGGAAMGFAGGEAIAVSPDSVRKSVGNNDERHLGYARSLLESVPETLMTDIHDPLYARAVVYAMLAAPMEQSEQVLTRVLEEEKTEVIQRARQHLDDCRGLERAAHLPLLELAIPAIAELNDDNAERLLEYAQALIKADARVTVFEYAVLSLLEHALSEPHKYSGKRPDGNMRRMREDCAVVLSLLAYAGQRRSGEAEQAFSEAAARLPLDNLGAIRPRETIALPQFSESLERLNGLKYRFKAAIIEACVAAISADGKVTVTEAELLRAIGARLDCPIPPLLPDSLS